MGSTLLSCRPQRLENKYPANGKGALVEIRYQNGNFGLYRSGKPYYIQGAAGGTHLDYLVKSGGNSLRTWTTVGLDSVLQMAEANGLTVLVGLDVVAGRLGLDYSDDDQVKKQEERIIKDVMRYKDHPSVLMWALGNELELNYSNPDLWPAINQLAKRIHEVDPNHPIATILLPEGKSVRGVARHCPEVDIVGFNTFAALYYLPDRVRQFWWLWDGPYFVSEYGPRGWWEVPTTDWQAPLEDPGREKEKDLEKRFKASFLTDKERCLGGYVFFWGQKQEKTHTWFSMFSETGEKTSMVDAVSKLWSGKYVFNRAPRMNGLIWADLETQEGRYLEAGKTYEVYIDANDPENDPLTYEWELVPEGDYANITGGDKEARPVAIPGKIAARGASAVLTAPTTPGPYRLFAYVRDGNGSIGSGNLPFYIMDDQEP
jgi:hypothetical protein